MSSKSIKNKFAKWIATDVIADAVEEAFLEADLLPELQTMKEYWYSYLEFIHEDAKRWAEGKLDDDDAKRLSCDLCYEGNCPHSCHSKYMDE